MKPFCLFTLEACFVMCIISGTSQTTSKVENDVKQELSNQQLKVKEIIVVIRDQQYKYHAEIAAKLKQNLIRQSTSLFRDTLEVVLLQDFELYGAWTIFPILARLADKSKQGKKWIVFCEEDTHVALDRLLNVLSKYDSSKFFFLGHPLYDREPSIIHHFAFADNPSIFPYPDFSAGWAVSSPLLKSMHERLSSSPPRRDFSIDVQHEVAMFIYNQGKGQQLTPVAEFCINPPLNDSRCAMWTKYKKPDCGAVDVDDIFVAVKTCKKFHKDRVPVIKKTVQEETNHLIYFSDVVDPTIPTEITGIPNTERGHCGKLFKIFAISQERPLLRQKPWVVIIDDDTIMSLTRLRTLLACYDANEPILLGERYGYAVNYYNNGYDYITGGGGMILSRAGIKRLLASGCHCPSNDTPDDMWLGNCFRSMEIPAIHNPSLHQARPMEYAKELLDHRYLVSFHKHYNLDPMTVYKDYLITSPAHQHIGQRRDEL